MGGGCGGAGPSLADEIRNRYAEKGYIGFSFLHERMPDASDAFVDAIANDTFSRGTFLLAGTFPEERLNDLQQKFPDDYRRYEPELKELQHRSPLFQRIKYLSEQASQFCILDNCEKERERAKVALTHTDWSPLKIELSIEEVGDLIEIGAGIYKDIPIGSAFASSLWDLAGEHGKTDLLREMKTYYLQNLWNPSDRVRGGIAQKLGDEVVAIAEKAIRDGDHPEMAVEYLRSHSLGNTGELTALAEKYQRLADENPDNDLYQFATGLFYETIEGKSEDSVRYLKRAIALKPDNPEYLYILGRNKINAHLNNNNGIDDETVKQLERTVELRPEDIDYQLALGTALSETKRPDEAVTHLQRVPAGYRVGASYWLGVSLLSSGRGDEAENAFQTYLSYDLHAKDKGIKYISRLYFDKNEKAQALRYAELDFDTNAGHAETLVEIRGKNLGQGVTYNPVSEYEAAISRGSFKALLSLAEFYKKTGNTGKFLETLRRIVNDSRSTAEDCAKAGEEFNNNSKYQDAVTAYSKAVKLEPGNDGYHNELGRAYDADSLKEEALKQFEEAAKLGPTEPAYYSNIGGWLVDSGRYGDAVGPLKKAIDLDAQFTVAHWHLAVAYSELRRFAEADVHYKKFLELSEDNNDKGNVLYAQGESYLKRGAYGQARRAFEEAKKLNEGLFVASKIVESLRKEGRYAEAIKTVEGLPEGDRKDYFVLLEYARTFLAMRDYSGAIPVLERLTQSADADKEIYDELEKSYRMTGKPEKAEETHQRWITSTIPN